MNWRKKLIAAWSWKLPCYALLCSYPLLALMACVFADPILFQPPGNPYSDAGRKHFTTLGQGETAVAICHLPATPGRPTILWSHGNAENLESVRPMLKSMNARGFGVISYDYPGYGNSGGKPNEEGCYQAIEKTYHHLTDTLGCDPKDIILIGQSVGSGPTCWLAKEKEHRGVVLISPFLSAFRTFTRIPIFPFDRFPNLKRITEFETPLLIIHGEEDQIIPFQDGQKLFELSTSDQKSFVPVPNAGHNDIFAQASFDLVSLLTDFFGADPS
ncbi:MAG: pimeloyl-ACP methyl ester carboxylesterase [Paracoccaceae bacterium]|jgi:pimeloyl-ACP methyl ester carboxylesterase